MLTEDVHSDEDQHAGAHGFGQDADPGGLSDPFAQVQTDGCEQGGYNADDYGGDPDGDIDHGEAEAHGQRIQAGGHGEHHHGHPAGGVLDAVAGLVVFECLAQHALGHEYQQAEGDPVAHAGNQLAYRQAGGPADYGHQGLEEAEVPCQPEILAPVDLSQTDAGGDGHGKRIHGKGHGDGTHIEQGHVAVPLLNLLFGIPANLSLKRTECGAAEVLLAITTADTRCPDLITGEPSGNITAIAFESSAIGEALSRDAAGTGMAETELTDGDLQGYCFHHFYPFVCKETLPERKAFPPIACSDGAQGRGGHNRK